MHMPKDNIRDPLYVCCVVFNPIRFKSRWKLFRDFQKRVRDAGAILITVEAAFGEREFALQEHANPDTRDESEYPHPRAEHVSHGPAPVPHAARMPDSRRFQDYIKIRVGQQSEIWLKENLMNLACQHLPEDAKYVAFIDADIQFARPDWVSETLHALQHFHVVQMFSVAVNLNFQYEPIGASYGFGFCHNRGVPRGHKHRWHCGSGGHPPDEGGVANAWHTGFAWAWRVSALDHVGGLLEHGILGAGDNHMARCLVGRGQESINRNLAPSYKRRVLDWQRRCDEHIKRNVGYIDGTILHYYHGRILNRRYTDRWKILVDHQFCPDRDMKKDRRGVLMLTDRKPALRDEIRRYFRSRDEDSIDNYESDSHLLGPSPARW